MLINSPLSSSTAFADEAPKVYLIDKMAEDFAVVPVVIGRLAW
jgi:hypothetical protein